VRIAAFDGENADPSNGRPLGHGLRVHTPWGELAHALAGAAGYEIVRKSDIAGTAPGADTLRELFGGEPTLILLDELSIYLRKVGQLPGARDQLTAFLTSLFKAVEGTNNACVVFTLAIGKDGKSTDAYSAENVFVSEKLAEAESVAARKATLLDPTEEDETAQVLRRRLFKHIDDARVAEVAAAYAELWSQHCDLLPAQRLHENRAQDLGSGYPLHPALMAVLTGKLSTLSTFQAGLRSRSMRRHSTPSGPPTVRASRRPDALDWPNADYWPWRPITATTPAVPSARPCVARSPPRPPAPALPWEVSLVRSPRHLVMPSYRADSKPFCRWATLRSQRPAACRASAIPVRAP
jgi:hypothetical protein